MTKPLPIGIFKKKPFVDLDILNKAVNDFDPNSKIGHVFVVDIHFQEFNYQKKKMYNEIYPCIFEPKTKFSADEKSVYQLLSNMRVRKKDNIFNYCHVRNAYCFIEK